MVKTRRIAYNDGGKIVVVGYHDVGNCDVNFSVKARNNKPVPYPFSKSALLDCCAVELFVSISYMPAFA